MNELSVIKIGYLNSFYLTYDEIKTNFEQNYLIVETEKEGKCSKIKFRNIRMLKIRSLDNMVQMVIAAQDIRFQQMEKINYKVIDTEYDSFSFFCESYEFL